MNEQSEAAAREQSSEEQTIEELFLLHLRYKEARRMVTSGANKPILLNEEDICWVVYSGHVDVFAVHVEDGVVTGSRTFVCSVEAGEALFGIDLIAAESSIGLLAVGSGETRLLKLSRNRLQRLGREEEYHLQIALLVDGWIRNLSHGLELVLPPKDCVRLAPGDEISLSSNDSICAKEGILWAQHQEGSSYFMGKTTLPPLNGNVRWPISNRTWLKATEDSKLVSINTEKFLYEDPEWQALRNFHQLTLRYIRINIEQAAGSEKARLKRKTQADRQMVKDAFVRLLAPLQLGDEEAPTPLERQKPLLQACQTVGEHMNLAVKAPKGFDQQRFNEPLKEIAKASQFRLRKVALKGDWWEQDNGPLLGYLEDGEQPVALLPTSPGKYELYNPAQHQRRAIDEEVMEELSYFAYMFYRPFPHQVMSTWELLKFGVKGHKRDLWTLLLAGAATGILSLVVPVATKTIFDTVIPNGSQSQLIQIGIALIVIALAAAMFQITQNLAILRLTGKLSASVQSALWDRVLSLPVSFFRNYTAGDLGTRVMGITTIEQTLSGPVVGALFTGLFSVFSFALLFYYDVTLAAVATGLILLLIGATAWAGSAQLKHQRALVELRGKLSGIVLQVITGITKFRAAGAEGRAFASWAGEFSNLKQITFKARDAANNLTVFNAGYYIVTSMMIFIMVVLASSANLTTGTFLAFNAAFIQLLTAVLTLSTTFISILTIVPTYERAKPIFHALPEISEHKAPAGELKGNIEVSHVSFRYQPDGPLVLNDVSLEAHAGEFVALVGASGSGKTTLFRLLLGFETPTSGAIFYDGQDLSGLDVRDVRRQTGVVLQDGQLMVGDIFTNIVGSSLLTLDDAWEAARMVGLDEDLEDMPMGMHTVITSGGGGLSGGQQQRILIARAIVHKPRVLFFDEATSALDNRTQEIVSESLENLQATRIVIAHRLSTIMNADRIYVLEKGKVVQHGTYEELMNQPGLFANLAKRQVI